MKLSEILQQYAGKDSQSDIELQKESPESDSASTIEESVTQTDIKLLTHIDGSTKDISVNSIKTQLLNRQIDSNESLEDLPLTKCYACKRTLFWRLVEPTYSGPWICNKCHPPAPRPELIEWNNNNE